MNQRRQLKDILTVPAQRNLDRVWATTAPAPEQAPIPPGDYLCQVENGELTTAKTGTNGYKVAFKLLEGELAGQRVWHDFWLTPPAMPMTKRDLAKLGITESAQLDRPIPPGIIVKARIVLRRDDDGTERNRVARFELVEIRPPVIDPFAPAATEVDTTVPAEAERVGTNSLTGRAVESDSTVSTGPVVPESSEGDLVRPSPATPGHVAPPSEPDPSPTTTARPSPRRRVEAAEAPPAQP